MNKSINLLLILLFLPIIYADCSITKDNNNVTVYDFIEPSGRGSDCVATLLQNGYLFDKDNMTGNDLYYSVNFTNLNYAKEYKVFIECNVSTTYYYSECFFTLNNQIGNSVAEESYTVVNLKYPFYMEVNVTEYIILYSTNLTLKNTTILIDGVTYQMDNYSTYWSVGVTSTIEEDTNFTIYINDSVTTEPLYNKSGVMRWRDPFYVDFYFYKDGEEEEKEPYLNDFQYLFLFNTSKIGETWLTLNDDTDWFSWMDPFYYKVMGIEYTPNAIDSRLAFWSNYKDGHAQVKLYEQGNYSVNLESTKSKSSIGWKYEFIFPQDSESQYYKSVVNIEITEESDQTYEVYINKFELNSFKFVMNWVWYSLLILFYIALVVGVAILTKDLKITSIISIVFLTILITVMSQI